MQKKYIKLNNNEEHLSLGNLFRIIKELSKNKSGAIQSEIFCTIFEIESINDTTVNNYCVGARRIGDEYKQIYLNKEKKYLKNNNEYISVFISLLSIIDGKLYQEASTSFINQNQSALKLATKLYNLAKNDKEVPNDISYEINNYIKDGNIYDALIKEFNYIILYKRQPLFESELKKEVIDKILNDTNISSVSLDEYLSLKLNEGINYDHELKKLGFDGNALANFELGCNEYYGFYKGYPRYNEAFEYLDKAASLNHAGAAFMIGYMYINGYIGAKTNDELKKGYEYIEKAKNLGSIAALNTIGNMYKDGIYPLTKDLDKAQEYYENASKKNYVFAFNNLGKIKENKGDIKGAYDCYIKSADLGESWAANKIGEMIREKKVKRDMMDAFKYYNKALESSHRTLAYYAYFNLAKYFYLKGYDSFVKKDEEKAIKYFKIASEHNIMDADIELLFYYINKNDIDSINYYKNKIEMYEDFSNNIKILIENKLKEIKEKPKLNLDI